MLLPCRVALLWASAATAGLCSERPPATRRPPSLRVNSTATLAELEDSGLERDGHRGLDAHGAGRLARARRAGDLETKSGGWCKGCPDKVDPDREMHSEEEMVYEHPTEPMVAKPPMGLKTTTPRPQDARSSGRSGAAEQLLGPRSRRRKQSKESGAPSAPASRPSTVFR
mmetsp:Transcript_39099/g.111947  ORF Transcript_39099/g.111947 Transcript_39099/m.111947 type:complete len:170 (-) Transcript_39099:156-665(-)